MMKTPDSMLFLSGGGSKEQTALLDTAFVEQIKQIKKAALEVAYIPVAMDQRQDKHPYASCLEWFKDIFQNHIDLIEMWTDLNQLTFADLEKKDAIYVGGGDTDVLLHRIKMTGFDVLLKQFIKNGGAYYGGSAGAIILGRDIRTAEEVRGRTEPIVESFEGLNLLHGYSVFPHFNKGKDAFSAATVQRLVTELSSPIIAIPEESGVLINENQMRIVGTQSVRLFSHNGEIELHPDENKLIELPVP